MDWDMFPVIQALGRETPNSKPGKSQLFPVSSVTESGSDAVLYLPSSSRGY